MSCLSVNMTMRAEVLRNIAAADAHGNRGKPEWGHISDATPCFVWSRIRQRVVDGHQNAEVEEMQALFRYGADIKEGDRITEIKDRRGRVLFAGPLEVITGTEKSTGDGVSYLAFKLRRIQ